MNYEQKKEKEDTFQWFNFILLLIYLIGMVIYYLIKLPVKNVKVEGISILKESEIIEPLGLEDNLPFLKFNKSYVKDRLKDNPLVDDFKIKKNLNGQVTIIINEAKILFYYNFDNKLVLSNGKTMDDSNDYLGYPTLVNYVPSDIYKGFINKFSKIDKDIIAMISEIEYDPDKFNDIIVDNERFLFTMNDGNKVYINVANLEKMNKYQNVVSKTNQIGILYLDSSSNNFIFKVAKANED